MPTGPSRLAPLLPAGALAVLAGCAHTGAARIDPDLLPVLPSPRADLYTRAPGTPRDPLVASVADGLPWDEALSGVASAVALADLSGEKVDDCRLRWMAVLAGYPYPVRGWLAASTAKGEVPERLLEEARAYAARGRVDIGLVRAREDEIDRWVLVVGDHTAEIPAVPRELRLGEEVSLAGMSWVGSDPLGEVRALDGTLVADIPGEWLLAARAGGRTVASFPVYVGDKPPEMPPLQCDARAGAPEQRVSAMVADLRSRYQYAPLARDPALDSVARARLRALAAGGDVPDARAQLRAAGFVGVPVAAGECRAATVEACVSNMWWSPEDRGALVGDLADYGVAVEEGKDGVRVVILGAG